MAALRKASYLKTMVEVARYDGFPALDRISAPCLVLVGEHDAIASPDLARTMTARIKGAGFNVIAGAGHVSNMENPEAFNAVVLRFLLSVERPGGTRR